MFRPISIAEKEYIIAGCASNIRGDGRGCQDLRSISIESDILPHVNGSSRITIGAVIDIICSIKLEISEPTSTAPSDGIIEFSAEYSPSCDVKVEERKLQDIGSQVSEHLQSVYIGSNTIDLKKFSIISGKYCWAVYIDLLILRADGPVLDGCSFATYIALKCAKYPKLSLLEGETGLMEDFDLSTGDLSEAVPLPLNSPPISISLYKIGPAFLLDCTAAEQACASCSLTIFVNDMSQCCGIRLSAGGAVNEEELRHGLEVARLATMGIFPKLDHVLVMTAKEDALNPDAPPFRLGLLY